MVTAEAAYCALGAANTRVQCLPTTLGVDHRIINGRVYIGGNAVTDPAEIERRTVEFQKRAFYYYANWEKLYDQWKQKMLKLIEDAQGLPKPSLPEFEPLEHVHAGRGIASNHDLLVTYQKTLEGYFRMWHHHFEFLLLGYGTKVGLAPMHAWLPDAHAEGPTPISAVLSGLLLNVALYAVVRSKALVDGALGSTMAGALMMGFGLLSVVVAAFFLSRQKDVKRLFAYSSIEHMGLTTFAFGMGGPVATFAAMLHMTVHSLTKSAIFFVVGHAVQKTGTQQIDQIRGLNLTNPTIGWGLMLGSIAILGLPPFGVFASEFLILTTAMRDHPWATPFLLVALVVAFAAVFSKAQGMVFGDTTAQRLPHSPSLAPVFVHFAQIGRAHV